MLAKHCCIMVVRVGDIIKKGDVLADGAATDNGELLRTRAKITSHFGISSSGHFWQIFKSKNLEIVHYYCVFYS